MPALDRIREATLGSPYEGRLWLVGGAVRDEMLGISDENDFDIVLETSALELARFLHESGISDSSPAEYPRFGTAMVRVEGSLIEIATARKESYQDESRKPDVRPATLAEDAARRDFTVNAIMRNLHDGQILDAVGGLPDLERRILRTPLEPEATFHDDPLRMLRAVRFRWKLGFEPAPGLYESIQSTAPRLSIVSMERVRDELVKILLHPTAADALDDLRRLGLLDLFAPELLAMVGVEQGNYHHLDVWDHSLLVMRQAGQGDLVLTLAALLHDVGKPVTRSIDDEGRTRFFGHETVGGEIARAVLSRLRFPSRVTEAVCRLVRHHMRLGSSPVFTPSAARRLIRDMGEDLPKLLELVKADTEALKPGLKKLDLEPIREQIRRVRQETPPERLQSPLSGEEIMEITGLPAGPEIGRIKHRLAEDVIEGRLSPDDRESAIDSVRAGTDEPSSEYKNDEA